MHPLLSMDSPRVGDPKLVWSDSFLSTTARAPIGLWDEFLALIAGSGLFDGSGSASTPDGLHERSIDHGSLHWVLDRRQRFVAVHRTIAFASPSPGCNEIEVFWCPLDDQTALCGHRLREVGQTSPEATQWIESWTQWSDGSSIFVVPTPWGQVPSFLRLVATWTGQGPALIDLTAFDASRFQVRALEDDLAYHAQLNDELRQEIKVLRSQLHQLRSAAQEHALDWARGADGAVDLAGAIWQDLGSIEEWSLAHSAKIAVLPRALKGAKKSDYVAPEHVQQALEFLAGPYRDCRLGRITKDEMERALENSGLKVAGSAGTTVAGAQGDAYFVNWRGRKRFLEWHIGRGGARETRYCLRIYFFWCEEDQVAVVGWLPSHLSCSIS